MTKVVGGTENVADGCEAAIDAVDGDACWDTRDCGRDTGYSGVGCDVGAPGETSASGACSFTISETCSKILFSSGRLTACERS